MADDASIKVISATDAHEKAHEVELLALATSFRPWDPLKTYDVN